MGGISGSSFLTKEELAAYHTQYNALVATARINYPRREEEFEYIEVLEK
jgi:hypothetical protein